MELCCRVCSSLEILFVLLVLRPSVNFFDSMFILAFTSLFANLLFFLTLQLVGREGGLFMSTTKLGIAARQGIFLAAAAPGAVGRVHRALDHCPGCARL